MYIIHFLLKVILALCFCLLHHPDTASVNSIVLSHKLIPIKVKQFLQATQANNSQATYASMENVHEQLTKEANFHLHVFHRQRMANYFRY